MNMDAEIEILYVLPEDFIGRQHEPAIAMMWIPGRPQDLFLNYVFRFKGEAQKYIVMGMPQRTMKGAEVTWVVPNTAYEFSL